MGTRQKRTQSDYSLAFKQGVVDAVEKGEMTYKQAQRLYGIQGRSTVLVWLRKLGRQDWSTLAMALARHQPAEIGATSMTPEQRIKQLEAELARAKDESLVYKTMLDVLAKEHGVHVVKKPLPEQRKSSKKGRA